MPGKEKIETGRRAGGNLLAGRKNDYTKLKVDSLACLGGDDNEQGKETLINY